MKIGKFKLGKWKIVLLFFAVMLGCTVLSRAADAMTLPKVVLGSSKSGTLRYTVEGEGCIAAEAEELVFLPTEVKVVSAAAAGTEVKAGDVLAMFDVQALGEACEQSRSQLKKLELNLEQEKLNGEPAAWLKEQDGAQRNVTKLDGELSEAQAQLGQKRAQYEQRSAETDFTQEEGQELEGAIAQLESKIEELRQSLSQAQDALEAAKSNDEVTEANQQRQRKLAEFTKQSLQIDIEEKQKEIERLEQWSAAEGRFCSPVDGTVTETTAVMGGITSGSEYFKIGNGNTRLTAYVAQDAAAGLKERDKAVITSQDGKNAVDGTVLAVHAAQRQGDAQTDDAGNSSQMEVMVQLEANELAIGEQVHFRVTKESKEYKCLIPVSVIREDSQGTYVLIMEERNSILGKEMVASRTAVRVLEKNDSDAAVESALTKEDKIIASSNKTVKAGDRIREE